jgi:hypothetical protein
MTSRQAGSQQVKGHDFQGNPIEEFKTSPDQLVLFQDVLPPGTSSTIELYDAMPKFFGSTKDMQALRQKNGGQFLDTLTRNFVHRNEGYVLTIRPARIQTTDGEEREFYPTKREDLIEQALRKLATDPKNGIYLGGSLAVQFSMSELRRELERTGHGMSYSSLMEGLQVNNFTSVTLGTKDGKKVVSANIFPMLMHASREQWEKNPTDTKCYVKFHPLVTASVEELTNRRMNYETFMKLDRTLSHYLYKRMSHNYVQADFNKPYSICLTTLMRDCGMTASAYPSDDVKRVKRTLHEFKDKQVIMHWDEEVTRGANNRIVDVKFLLYPSVWFKDDAVMANKQQQQSKVIASKMGIGSPNRPEARDYQPELKIQLGIGSPEG